MLKVGDKVVCINSYGASGLKGTNELFVTETRKVRDYYFVRINSDDYWFNEDRFKLYEGEEDMKIEDLKRGMRVTFENGDLRVVDKVCYEGDGTYRIYFVKANLRTGFLENMKNNSYEETDIVEVEDLYAEGDYFTIWKREKETEMTIAEIEDKLGIKGLKIVGEDK